MQTQFVNLENQLYGLEAAQRQQVCLSLHAAILGRLSIPRVWIPLDIPLYCAPAATIQVICHECFFTPVSQVLEQTARDLALLRQPLQHLNAEERNAIRLLVEEFIQAESGLGCVHYERMRFTPDTEQDVYSRLKVGAESHLYWMQGLLDVLQTRAEMAAASQLEHGQILNFARRQSPVFSKQYRIRVDADWCAQWQSHERYRDLSPERRSIHTLPLIEGF